MNIPEIDPGVVISAILDVVYVAAGVTAVIMIIVGGYMYATASGKPDKIVKARDTILYAVLGLVVAGLAFAITQFVFKRFQ